jgi:hypothetical protein
MNAKCGDLTPLCQYAVRDCYNARTKADDGVQMNRLWNLSPSVHDYLANIPVRDWAAYTFIEEGVRTYGIDDNNTAECEASRMVRSGGPRLQKTPIAVLTALCHQVGNAIAKRQTEVAGWDEILVPKAMMMMNDSLQRLDDFDVTLVDINRGIYRVEYNKNTCDLRLLSFRTVCIQTKSCSCGCWQDLALPGVHPLAVFHHLKKGTTPIKDEVLFYEWVDKSYRVSSARQAYLRSVVTPCQEEIEASESFLTQNGWKPEQERRPGGQPKAQKRIPSTGERRRG